MSISKWGGYHDCPCRDCFDIAIGGTNEGAPDDSPALCHACEVAGCDDDGHHECNRSDAYGMDDDNDTAPI